jgi:drug/metabolite transporter (DMT)-like permease
MVLALAIASSLSLGLADYLAGVTLRRDGRQEAVLTYTTVGFAVGLLVVVAAIPAAPIESFSACDIGWSIAAGAAFGVSVPLIMVGMARGPIAVVAPVLGLTSLAVPAIAGPLLGDQLSGLEVAGLLIAFPAAAMVATAPHSSDNAFPIGTALLVALAAGAFLGGAAVFFGRTSTESGIGPGVVAQMTGLVLLIGVSLSTGRLLRPKRDAVGVGAVVGLLSGLAVFLSVLAYQRGPVAIVAAVIGLAPGPTVVFAWWLMNEKINRVQLAGFVLGAAAVLLFAVG